MPGAGVNRRRVGWANESRAAALRHVLESARYHAKAGTEARGRQIAEGWRLADRLANGSTFWSGDRLRKRSTSRDRSSNSVGSRLNSSSNPVAPISILPNLPKQVSGDGILNFERIYNQL